MDKELDNLKRKYLKLYGKTEVPKTYKKERLLELIDIKLKEQKEFNKRVKKFREKLSVDYKDCKINQNSMLNYFTKTSVDKFDFKYSKTTNDFNQNNKAYDIYDVVIKAIKENIKPREEFKKSEIAHPAYEAKYKYIEDVLNKLKIIQFENELLRETSPSLKKVKPKKF